MDKRHMGNRGMQTIHATAVRKRPCPTRIGTRGRPTSPLRVFM
jgi:hypothetical protein